MKEILRQRMYHLVLYNISPIQQGIQAYHAGIEFSLRFDHTDEYVQWATKDKVVIILNGGTSNNLVGFNGSMEKHHNELINNGIPCAHFEEPDLNNATTAIAFLVDERVWDKEKYPDPEFQPRSKVEPDFFLDLVKLYGEEVAFLRKFLSQFRLA